MSIDFDSVKRSYGRCVITRDTKEAFFSTFYEKFLNSNIEIKMMFENTKFDKQIIMLKNAITMAILYAEKQDELALDVLTKIRRSHSRSKRNVKPEYYEFWLISLLDTLWTCDPQFSEELESDWRNMLMTTIDFIVEGYEQSN